MKATTICKQSYPAKDFYHDFLLSASDEQTNAHIGGFSAQPKKHPLPGKKNHTSIFEKWFDKVFRRYFPHHPILTDAFFFVAVPIGVLFTVICALTLLMLPIELFFGWL